jgi:hypothetical protein
VVDRIAATRNQLVALAVMKNRFDHAILKRGPMQDPAEQEDDR